MTHRNLSAPAAEPQAQASAALGSPVTRTSTASVSLLRLWLDRALRPLGRGRCATLAAVFLAALLTVALTACTHNVYQFPLYNFAGRPVPPSSLAERVLVAYTTGTGGSLEIMDALRDQRNNIQNTKPAFFISGFSGAEPTTILNYPAELKGYVYSDASPYSISQINYSTEATTGAVGATSGPSASFAIAPLGVRIYNAEQSSAVLTLQDNSTGASYGLNLPNVYKVFVNTGDTVALAMVKNSNTLYRIVKLNINQQVNPPGAIDCEPNILPVYCVVPVPGTFDRPVSASFSLDGSTAYILSCGVECGGGGNGGSGVSFIPQGSIQINNIPTSTPYPAVVTSTVSLPGGATTSISDGTNLYFAGQQQQPDGLFEGFLTIMPLATLVPGKPIPISDGTHTKMLFADGPTNSGMPLGYNPTLWIGSQQCSNGERAKLGLNVNCLTRVVIDGTASPAAGIIPANVVPGGSVTVPYPNGNADPYYYGSLTGICWVQGYFKVYTAYGGQVHVFSTLDGSEINNFNVTVQGTALDVAYMDALTDVAN